MAANPRTTPRRLTSRQNNIIWVMATLLGLLAEWYKRRRHSYGFGVHSPLAYRLVRTVLMERCSYYAYADIADALDASAGGCRRRLRRAKMLHRLAARFPRPSVRLVGTLPREYAVAIETALPKANSDCFQPCLTVGCASDDASAAELAEDATEHITDGDVTALFGIDSAAVEAVWEAMPYGVLLAGTDALVAVADSRVTKVAYTAVI